MKKSLSIILWCFSIALSQWEQDRFIIGAFYEPPLTGVLQKDIEIMNQIRNARFTVLSGTGDYPSNAKEMKYRLEVLANIPGLRTYVSDKTDYGHRVYGTDPYDSTLVQNMINYYKGLPQELRNEMYGYFICDEPHYGLQLSYQLQKINHFQRHDSCGGDPKKHVWINLFANRVSDFLDHYPQNSKKKSHPWHCMFNETRYRDYIRDAIGGGVKTVSFDNYCFTTSAYYVSSPQVLIRPDFFRNYQIVAEESQKAGIPFWAIACCVEHISVIGRDGEGKAIPRIEYDGPIDYRTGSKQGSFTHIPEEQLRFMAYVPVIYGAKGIWWFLYAHKQQSKKNSGWFYSKDALVDENGLPTRIFPMVQTINQNLEALGPMLMELHWLGTFHGSSINPMLTATDDPSKKFIGPPESNLPQINRDTPVIKGIKGSDSRYCVAGIFDHRTTDTFTGRVIIIMNKKLHAPSTFTILFKDKTTSIRIIPEKKQITWKKNEKIKSIKVWVLPGDIKVIKVSG